MVSVFLFCIFYLFFSFLFYFIISYLCKFRENKLKEDLLHALVQGLSPRTHRSLSISSPNSRLSSPSPLATSSPPSNSNDTDTETDPPTAYPSKLLHKQTSASPSPVSSSPLTSEIPTNMSEIHSVGPFILGKTLGEGATGRVKLAFHKERLVSYLLPNFVTNF